MPTSTSSHRGYTLPGATVPDKRLEDIQAIKSALVSIDVDIANALVSPVQSVAGKTGAVVIATTDIANCGTNNIPQNSKSVNYTCVLSDSGKHLFHPSADTTARTWTIPANASVAYDIGTALTFINQNAGGAITIAITSDVMRLAGAGTVGSRTLAANGVATAIKITDTEWIISGTNLT